MSVEARAAALELADEVLRAFHGDACARVGALLLKHADGLTLRDLRRRLPDQPDVATALVALLQHGEGRARHASPDESRPPVYTVDLDAVLRRPRQARALRALRRHSSEGAKVIEACLEAGCCSTSRLREVARDDALLTQLATYGVLAKCDGVEGYKDVNTNTLFDEKNRDLPDEKTSKAKSRAAAMGQAIHSNDGSVWRCSHRALKALLRREATLDVIEKKLNKRMRRVAAALWDLGAVRAVPITPAPDPEDDADQREERENSYVLKYAAKVADVEALVRRRHGDAAAKKVGQDLELLQGDHVRFVSSQRQKYGRGDTQETYLLEPERCRAYIRSETVSALVKQKLDSDAARLHRALSEHEHLAESDIAERALLPPKDARTKLYALFHLGFARHVELPRQADRPGGAIQLWKADCERSRVVVLADTRRALARLLKRRRFECEKDEGLDPFSLDDSRAADPRKRERLRGRLDRLDRAILQLDEACELFEDDDVQARLPDNDDGDFEWREAT